MDFHEEIIVVVNRATSGAFVARYESTAWDLIFTNRRVIVIKTRGLSPLKVFLWGIWYLIYEDRRSRRRSKAIRDAPLPEILASAEEKDFFNYSELESVTLRLRCFLPSEIHLKQRGERGKRFFASRRALKAVLDAAMALRLHGAPIR